MIYLLLAILSSASLAVVMKIFRTQTGNRYAIILGNYLTCILISFLLLPDRSAVFSLTGTTLVCGIIAGFFFVAGLVLMQSSIRINGATLTAAFAKLGLIIPLFVSILFLGERPGPLQICGILLVLCAIVLMHTGEPASGADSVSPAHGAESGENSGKRSTEAASGSLLLLLLTLAGCGGGDTMAKLFERIGERSQDGVYFLVLFITAALLTVLLAILEYRKTGKRFLPQEFLAGIAVGIPNYFSSVLLLQALVHLPAFIVYPSFSTGTILAVAAVSAAAFQERPGRRQLLSLGIILGALILLNL